MLLRNGLVLLLTGLLFQASSQTGPTLKPTQQIPDNVIYEAYFRQVASMEDLAGQLESQGKSAESARGRIQASAELTGFEAQALKSVALDCRAQVAATSAAAQPLIDSARGQAASSGAPSAAIQGQLHALQVQREAAVDAHILQLRKALGESRFWKLDAYIRRTSPVKAYVLDFSSAKRPGK
jgi:hypothetical protein